MKTPMKTLGFLALGNNGETLKLTNPKHPRKQLLERLGRKHADLMYRDNVKSGKAVHCGWVVGGVWWSVYRVCPL